MRLVKCAVFVVWKWEWISEFTSDVPLEGYKSLMEEELSRIPESDPDQMDEDYETNACTFDTHTVTFKVIGCTRDTKYQNTL